MGICTRCGYLSADEDPVLGISAELHDCTSAHIEIGKKARLIAQEQLVSDGVIAIDVNGAISSLGIKAVQEPVNG